MSSKLLTFTEAPDMEQQPKKKPPNAGKGRKKGIPNKVNKALKDMILGALEQAGGQEYLAIQAEMNPSAFLQLIGKVLPAELKHQGDVSMSVTVVTGVPKPDEK